MKAILSIIILIGILQLKLHAAELKEMEHVDSTQKCQEKKVNKLKDIFHQAEVEGHIRNFFMATINQGNLKDYYTNASGGAIGIITKPYKGFQFGIRGIFTYQTFSADLNEADPITGKASQWEHQLYDITDRHNFNDLDRLEELYLKYRLSNGFLSIGKIPLEDDPMINQSDGRMKPFAYSGINLNWNFDTGKSITISWLNKVSPRSTVEWYQIGDAIGISNNGLSANLEPANYHHTINSEGVGVINYRMKQKNFDIQLHNWFIHQLHNTSMLSIEYQYKKVFLGMQYARQFQLQNNLSASRSEELYIRPNENGSVLSTKVQHQSKKQLIRLAYSHAFSNGRFLFPRELGRDQFYTSIPRSRIEGFGNVNVITFAHQYQIKKESLSTLLECSRIYGADYNQPELNKYGLDEYYQINSGLHLEFKNFLEGMEMDVLYVYRKDINRDEAIELFNRSNFHQINFITNYNF